ncbi:MAG: hypothetical protein KJZ65_06240 [Phycisphaerales bacterium]|nr:hypothetical protein [Phycisphaerales bacterium]
MTRARRLARLLVPLLVIALLVGCSTVRGLGQDIQDGSRALHAAMWGDDPDAPPND